MIHNEMAHLMEEERVLWIKDSLKVALVDWVYLGQFTGFCSMEWYQKSSTLITNVNAFMYHLWMLSPTYTFILEDFEFFIEDKRRLSCSGDLDLSRVAYIAVRFCKQKNDVNNEIVLFYRDTTNPLFYPVRAVLRICARAQQLGAAVDVPLDFYTSAKRTTRTRLFITNSDVEQFFRGFSCQAFGLKDTDPILSRWSAHSIRVTACNLLHCWGFLDSYIQTRLRWRGNTWMEYLCNTLYSA